MLWWDGLSCQRWKELSKRVLEVGLHSCQISKGSNFRALLDLMWGNFRNHWLEILAGEEGLEKAQWWRSSTSCVWKEALEGDRTSNIGSKTMRSTWGHEEGLLIRCELQLIPIPSLAKMQTKTIAPRMQNRSNLQYGCLSETDTKLIGSSKMLWSLSSCHTGDGGGRAPWDGGASDAW